jgi:hypothetical protein
MSATYLKPALGIGPRDPRAGVNVHGEKGSVEIEGAGLGYMLPA